MFGKRVFHYHGRMDNILRSDLADGAFFFEHFQHDLGFLFGCGAFSHMYKITTYFGPRAGGHDK